jgi:SulP family sulfate permease
MTDESTPTGADDLAMNEAAPVDIGAEDADANADAHAGGDDPGDDGSDDQALDAPGFSIGTAGLRDAIGAAAARVVPSRSALRSDTIAGLVGAIGRVPDGMASALLAGINPINGLYASAIGPVVGGFLVAAPLLVVTSTSAGALSGGAAVDPLRGEERASALFLLIVLVGIIQLLAGILRLGRLTHFVSHSVMVGFLTGVASLIVLGQFGSITGTYPSGSNLQQAIEVVTHPLLIDPVSLLLGLVVIGITIAPLKGGLGKLAPLIAIAVPAVLALVFNLDVQTVEDVGDIPGGVPLPAIPQLSLLTPSLVTGALAVAAIILVQGAGVAESFPPSGGKPSQPSREFIAQGAANATVGLFQGLPVGASVGQTALSVSAGARTRWAAILSGVFMMLILLVFGPAVEVVPMPALAGLLIVAGVTTIKADEFSVIWRTGLMSRIVIVATFVATLLLPIQVAVAIGVLLSTVLYLNQASTDVTVTELIELPDGRIAERRPEPHLASDRVTVLDIQGSTFYAGARTVAGLLPLPEGAIRPVVVLRLRGRTKVGATFISVIDRYAGRLASVGGRLYLSGVDEGVRTTLIRSGKLDLGGAVVVESMTPIIGESTLRALADANAWLVEARGSTDPKAAGDARA